MFKNINYDYVIYAMIFFLLTLLSIGSFYENSIWKNLLSFITVFAFILVIGQFFFIKESKGVYKYHKYLGYSVISFLIIHPFLSVLSQWIELGVNPVDSFILMISQIQAIGILVGIIAWVSMLVLGALAIYKKKFKHSSWRMYHGLFSIIFVAFGIWHAFEIGKHSSLAMLLVMGILGVFGIFIVIKNNYTRVKNEI